MKCNSWVKKDKLGYDTISAADVATGNRGRKEGMTQCDGEITVHWDQWSDESAPILVYFCNKCGNRDFPELPPPITLFSRLMTNCLNESGDRTELLEKYVHDYKTREQELRKKLDLYKKKK